MRATEPAAIEEGTITPAPRRDLEAVASGLAQRAALIDAVLADLTGRRTLISRGALPPDVVAGVPGLSRAVLDLRAGTDRHVLFTTATVARNADGSWVVLDDDADAPADLDAFAARHPNFVGRLGAEIAGRATAGPAAVLDPRGPTAFSRALHLPAGDDFRVDGGAVLGPDGHVGLLLRLIPGAALDPMLGSHTSGVPGLYAAAAHGHVTLANHPAAGLAGTPSLRTFLPRLARTVLREDLELPSVATYWCGNRSMCSHVIANAGRLVLRSVDGRTAVEGRSLTIAETADVCARIADEPRAWVGEEYVHAEAPGPLRALVAANGSGWDVRFESVP